MDELIVDLAILAGYLFLLAVGGIVADYIFPHIRPLNRWIDSLPLMREDDGKEVENCGKNDAASGCQDFGPGES